tara:strand:+ start:8902 stop:9210 length:309 start_codon:yes stop_codon:yes gene_type:complete
MIEYKYKKKENKFTENGHTMFEFSVLQRLKRLADLEEQIKQGQLLPIDGVSVSFTDSERTEFVETTIFLNSQNLSGRETEDELYEAGIVDCFDDLIEKINER